MKDTTPAGSGGTGATPFTYAYQAAGTSGTQCGGKVGQVCAATDGNGKVTAYTYDASGNLTKVTPPSPLGATSYTYDGIGRVTGVKDGKGQNTGYVYDAADRITKITTNGGGTLANYYDADGHLGESDDSTNGSAYWDYDPLGREQWRQPSNTGGQGFSTGHDAAGNITSVTDLYGSVTYAYNTANQLTSMVEPSGSATATTTFGYNANGAETTRTLPNGIVQTTTRDNSGRATRIKAVAGSTVISDLSYSFTVPGGSGASGDRALVQTRTDAVGLGVPAGSMITYGYDGLSRVKSATEKTTGGATNASWSYTYDAAGNRTGATTAGATRAGTTASTASVSTTWGYNNASELTSKNGSATGWAYDANGNQTSASWGSATYDERDALTSATPAGSSTASSYAYFGIGNPARTSLPAGGSQISGPLGLAATFDASGNGVAFRATPDGRRISAELPDGTVRYYLTDNLGSVIAVTSGTATTAVYTYDPYGGGRATSGGEATSNPLRYTGGYTDTTGLYHYGYRYYDPTTGRFTQTDPAGREGNAWAYAASNPVNYVDPTGLITGTGAAGTAGAALGGVVAGVAAAAVCAGTAGVGCVLAFGIVGGAALGGTGGILGSKAAGASDAEAEDAGAYGLIGGAVGGLTGLK